MKTLVEYIRESLLQHVALELKDKDIIYEKYGEYDGCNELANYIRDLIESEHKNQDYIEHKNQDYIIKYEDVKHINNIVFDKLIVSYENIDDYKNYGSEYHASETTFDENTGRFSTCHISLKCHAAKVKSLLEHELTHLFNDYLLISKGLGSFVNLFDNQVYQTSKNFNDTSRPSMVRKLRKALYMLNEFEKNSFIAQLMDEIRDIRKFYGKDEVNHINAQKIYDIARGTDIYKAYEDIAIFVKLYYDGKLYKKEKEYIVEEWNKLYNTNDNIADIFKQLKRKIEKTRNKIETLIPKKIAEEYDIFNGEATLDGKGIFCNLAINL